MLQELNFTNSLKDIQDNNMAEDFDPKKPSEGLGDTIAKITNALGIDKVAEKVAQIAGKEDCGCGERRKKLNDIFPYNQDEQKAE
jgi:hypothetical protein